MSRVPQPSGPPFRFAATVTYSFLKNSWRRGVPQSNSGHNFENDTTGTKLPNCGLPQHKTARREGTSGTLCILRCSQEVVVQRQDRLWFADGQIMGKTLNFGENMGQR